MFAIFEASAYRTPGGIANAGALLSAFLAGGRRLALARVFGDLAAGAGAAGALRAMVDSLRGGRPEIQLTLIGGHRQDGGARDAARAQVGERLVGSRQRIRRRADVELHPGDA